MKRLKTLLALLLLALFVLPSYSQASDEYSEFKAINLDIGYGSYGLGAAAGFRYSFLSLTVGIAGFANDIPNYASIAPQGVIITPHQALPTGYVEDKYEALMFTADLAYNYDYEDFTFYGSLGYFTAQDSVLAKNILNGDRYSYKVENSSGISVGIGSYYSISEWICLGLGYNTKRGIFGQFVYTW